MAEKIALKIITPSKVVLSSEVDEVSAPGTLGEFGVLPGHVPFITTLEPGIVKYFQSGSESTLFISGGIFNVESDKAKVLTESAEDPARIDNSETKEQIEDLEKIISGLEEESEELPGLIKKLKIAQARLDV
jgi:F-type H+-transporting ATPase subunit epsilon